MTCHSITQPHHATTTAQPPTTGPTLRIGDDERRTVTTVLEQAVAAGYASMEEFTDRLDAVFRAVTAADLTQITADLPFVELRRRYPARKQAARPGIPPSTCRLPRSHRTARHRSTNRRLIP